MDQKKILAYIKGEITSEKTISEICSWIEQSQLNQETYTDLKNLWVLTGLHNLKEESNVTGITALRNKNIGMKKAIDWIGKYAALFVFAFLLGAGSLYLFEIKQISRQSGIYNEIKVPKGEKSILYFYDGTKVWLNSGTTLKYPVTFDNQERKVYVDGEAFFSVTKKKHRPFIVQADRMAIKVFGTRFNICAYHEDNEFYVTLEEGSVKAVNSQNQTGLILSPGGQAIFNRATNHFVQKTVDPKLYSSWKENMLRFEDASFAEVIKKMERWYDVQISVAPSINTGGHYTMTIKTESLREMLNLLAKTTTIKYEIKEDKVFITKP